MSASTRSALILPFLGAAIGVGLAIVVMKGATPDLRGQALPPAAGSEGAQCDMTNTCNAGLVCQGFNPFGGPGVCAKPIYCCQFQTPLMHGACKLANAGSSDPLMVCFGNSDGTPQSFVDDPTCGGLAAGAGSPCGFCGNGTKDPGEDCDDGNDSNNDFCSTTCVVQHLFCCNEGGNDYDRGICINSSSVNNCIDGTDIFYSWSNEDYAEVGADGLESCMTQCEVFNGNEGAGGCGDGIVFGAEECDDGNTDDDDGCSWDCEIEKERCCASLSWFGGTALGTQCTAATTGTVPDCIGTKRYEHSNTTCDYDCDIPERPTSSSSSAGADWCCMNGTYECRPVQNSGPNF